MPRAPRAPRERSGRLVTLLDVGVAAQRHGPTGRLWIIQIELVFE